jgi:hypothetical protein
MTAPELGERESCAVAVVEIGLTEVAAFSGMGARIARPMLFSPSYLFTAACRLKCSLVNFHPSPISAPQLKCGFPQYAWANQIGVGFAVHFSKR